MFTETIPEITKSVFGLMFYTNDGTTVKSYGIATGFMYSPKFIVTAGHCFSKLPKDIAISVIDADTLESQSQGFLVKVDHERDLAIIRVRRSLASHCIKLSNNIIPVGVRCGSLGFPYSDFSGKTYSLILLFQSGYVANAQDAPSGEKGYRYIIDSTTYPGSSGAPVFTEDGEVFGIVSSSLVDSNKGLPDERMVFTRCVSSLDIVEFCKDVKLKKRV